MAHGSLQLQCEAIDLAIRQYAWMDFEFIKFSFVEAAVAGCLDTTSTLYELELRFRDVAFVSAASSWHTDMTQPVFFLASASDDARLREQFELEKHQHAFAFRPRDEPGLFYVGAAEVQLIVLRGPNDD